MPRALPITQQKPAIIRRPPLTATVLSCALLLAAGATSLTASDAGPKVEAAQVNEQALLATLPALNEDLARLTDAKAKWSAAEKVNQETAAKIKLLDVTGDVERQEEGALLLYGVAVGNVEPGQLGLVTKKSFLVVKNPDQKKIIGGVGGSYYDQLAYQGNDRIGRPVYGPPPPALLRTRADAEKARGVYVEANERMREHLQRASQVVASIKQEQQEKIQALQVGLPEIDPSIGLKAEVLTYLANAEAAVDTLKTGIMERERIAAAKVTPARQRLLKAWSEVFPDIAAELKEIDANESSYRSRRNALIGQDLNPVLASLRSSIEKLPAIANTPEDLAKLCVGVRKLTPNAAAPGSEMVTKLLSVWLANEQSAYWRNPSWAYGDEAQIEAALGALRQGDPEGWDKGQYRDNIAVIEDAIGQRALAPLANSLSTVNPWTETRRLGLDGDDRRYHRALLMRVSGAQTGKDALDLRAVVAAEEAANPGRWSKGGVTQAYVDLSNRQLSAWVDSLLKSGDKAMADLPTIDRWAAASIADDTMSSVLPAQRVAQVLGVIEGTQFKQGPKSLLRGGVIDRLAAVIPSSPRLWYHGRLLLGIDRKTKWSEIFPYEAIAQNEALKHPELWSEVERQAWTQVIGEAMNAAGLRSSIDGSPSLWRRATAAAENFDNRNETRITETFRKNWLAACRTIPADEAAAMRDCLSLPYLRQELLAYSGIRPGANPPRVLSVEFWSEVNRDSQGVEKSTSAATAAPTSSLPAQTNNTMPVPTTTPVSVAPSTNNPSTQTAPAAPAVDPLFGN